MERSTARTRSPALQSFAWMLLGLGFGRGMSMIPSPADPHLFWIGNLCAPWLAIAFFAGRSQPSRVRALIAGTSAEVACVMGFYAQFLFLGPTALGLPSDTPFLQFLAPDVRHWLHFIAFWVFMAISSGAIYGLLGHWWKRSKPAAAAFALGLPFLAEPGLWSLRRRDFAGPVVIWLAEISFGLALTTLLMRRRTASSRAQPSER